MIFRGPPRTLGSAPVQSGPGVIFSFLFANKETDIIKYYL